MEPKQDYSTAILERKKAPNRLVVDDAEGGVAVDSSTVALSPGTMDALDIFHGDVVALRGKCRRETVCYAAKDESCPDGLARINRVVRSNLRLRLGDLVTVTLCAGVKGRRPDRHLPLRGLRRRHQRQPLRRLRQAHVRLQRICSCWLLLIDAAPSQPILADPHMSGQGKLGESLLLLLDDNMAASELFV